MKRIVQQNHFIFLIPRFVLVTLIIILTFFLFLKVFTFESGAKGFKSVDQSYKLPNSYSFNYAFLESDSSSDLASLITKKQNADLEWKETSFPTPKFNQKYKNKTGFLVYQFSLPTPSDKQIWAFAPLSIQHTSFKVFCNDQLIHDEAEWSNEVAGYVFPINPLCLDYKNDQFEITILARQDSISTGIYGYDGTAFYGPENEIRKISKGFFYATMFPQIILILGCVLTILLAVLVLWIETYKVFVYLVFYSIFYNLIPAFLNTTITLGTAHLFMYFYYPSLAIGSFFLGMFFVQYLSFQKRPKARFIALLIMSVLIAITPFWGYWPDHIEAIQRIVFSCFLVLSGICSWIFEGFSKDVEGQNKKLLIVFFVVLTILDISEYFIFHAFGYQRIFAIHLIFNTALLALSVRSFRFYESQANQKERLSERMQAFKLSFRLFHHDVFDPYNKLLAFTGILKMVKKPEHLTELQKKKLQDFKTS